jgi:hypothetical protein
VGERKRALAYAAGTVVSQASIATADKPVQQSLQDAKGGIDMRVRCA